MIGCVTPLPLEEEPSWVLTNDDGAELLVFRESGSHTKFAPLYFGSETVFTHRLNENEYFQLAVRPGEHKFRVGGNGAEPAEIAVVLESGTTTCVRLGTRADAWVSLIEIPYNSAIEAYALAVISCPSKVELGTLRKVSGKEM